MNPRPTIFISTVTKELRSARQLVANTLTFLGYEPVWQDIFGTETGDLRQMLRDKLDGCQGVVQLVGYGYGAEPAEPDAEFGRCSYTQYEALYARKEGIKVWYLFIDERFPSDPFEPEPEEQRQLQLTYRKGLKADSHLFHELASNEALEAGVLKLRDDLTTLRRRARVWAVAIVGLIVIGIALSVWLLRAQGDTQKSVGDVSEAVKKGNETIERIADRFESLASGGGLIADPKTPEEHYHNARIHELGGNFSAARKDYTEYLSANLEAIDPWLRYSEMLKASEGRAGAVETMRYFGDKLDPPTVSFQTALALLEEGDARLSRLLELAEEHPDFGPLAWLVSREYSPVRLGDQSLADQRSEKEWLTKFREAREGGKFLRFFIDQKEAEKWSQEADEAWARIGATPERVLENPVSLTLQNTNADSAVQLTVSELRVKELFWRLDGEGEFKSSGHLPTKNAVTGLPMANLRIPLPELSPGEHIIEVKYTDGDDVMNGPYPISFSTASELLAQGKMMINAASGSWLMFREYDGKLLLYFTTLMAYRPVISEVRYALDADVPDTLFEFEPSETMYEPGEKTYLAVPEGTRYATVQVTYKDGTKSEVQKVLHK